MNKALLAVLAHPDDESYGPGGTLALYARKGVDVHVAIATDGARGTAAEGFEDKQSFLAEHRSQELIEASNILGVTLHPLRYLDSGMKGNPSNDDPLAFMNADEDEAICKVVRLIREIRPQVIMTHDETGGYFHPDHIQCWNITTRAFHIAADPAQYPELDLPPHQPERLYYTAFPRSYVRLYTFLMRLRGLDPTRIGRNRDIDMTKLGIPRKKIHTIIDYREVWDVKMAASAAHGSQGGGGGFLSLLPEFMRRWIFGKEAFSRAYPPLPDGARERDLFPDTL